MTSLLQRTLSPLAPSNFASTTPNVPLLSSLATTHAPEAERPLAANTDADTLHYGDPKAPVSNVAMQTIMQRFLQDFEYVELEYPIEGSANNPTRPLNYHPHVHFKICSEDRESMNSDQRITYLSRQIDRGIYVIKKLGFDMDDFYIDPEGGKLSFDARVPEGKLPEGVSEKEVLSQLVDAFQHACTEARANRPQMAVGH
jgi:hypothetical protein